MSRFIFRSARDFLPQRIRLRLLFLDILISFGLVMKIPLNYRLDLSEAERWKAVFNVLRRVALLEPRHYSVKRHA